MIERIVHLDQALFLFLNGHFHASFVDSIMIAITDWKLWRPPFFVLFAVLCWRGGPKIRLTLVLAAVAVLSADGIVSHLIKPLIGRTRPCFALSGVHQLIPQSHSRSFPSAHAANTAAFAWVAGARHPRARIGAAVACFLLSYSRIHVGVHYPLDLLAGWIIGIACGGAVLVPPPVARRAWARLRKAPGDSTRPPA